MKDNLGYPEVNVNRYMPSNINPHNTEVDVVGKKFTNKAKAYRKWALFIIGGALGTLIARAKFGAPNHFMIGVLFVAGLLILVIGLKVLDLIRNGNYKELAWAECKNWTSDKVGSKEVTALLDESGQYIKTKRTKGKVVDVYLAAAQHGFNDNAWIY